MPKTIIHAVVGEVLDLPYDLRRDLSLYSGSEVITYEVAKPDGTAASWTCSQVPTTSEGYGFVKYRTLTTDLDQEGIFLCRPKLVDGGDPEFFEPFRIKVELVAA